MFKVIMLTVFRHLCILATLVQSLHLHAVGWSINEIHFQYGELETPSFANRGTQGTRILTFQHASGWAYGDNFMFVDHLRDNNNDIEGHIENIGERDNELDQDVSSWLFSQIQFRYDLGKQIFDAAKHLFIRTERQLWLNKLGYKNTDENAFQALLVWRF